MRYINRPARRHSSAQNAAFHDAPPLRGTPRRSGCTLLSGGNGPAVVTRPSETLDKALCILATLRAKDVGRDETVMLLWSPGVKRMITGSDVLRCLLSGMGENEKVAAKDAPRR